jgi:DNA (cytosine-5)-methyltransferase 1
VGIQQKLACEFDKSAAKTIEKNRPELPLIGDLLDYDVKQIRKISGLGAKQSPTLIVGGPPCQAFSTAGKRQAFNDPRGNVFLKYIELIGELQPKYAVIENVRGLLSASLEHVPLEQRSKTRSFTSPDQIPGSALNQVLKLLESFGYTVNFNLYNAANFGVPQSRERVILIAARGKKIVPFLTPTHSDVTDWNLPKWETFKSATKGLKESEMHSATFSEERLKFFRMLGPGEYWKHLPTEELKLEALGNSYYSGGGKTGFYRRLDWNKPSPTLVTHPAMPATELAHPEKDRPLSVEEYKRLQQFPDDWELQGSLVNQYKQLGNAVPVGLGAAVGRAVIDHIENRKSKIDYSLFKYSRYVNTSAAEWRKEYYERVEENGF